MNTKPIAFILIIAAVLLISGCTSQTQQTGSGPIETETSGNTLPPVATVGPIKEFNMTAKRFEFSPSTITVNRGDRVVLNIRSIDTTHGFSLATYNIIRTLEPHQTEVISFVATEAGEFNFFCSVFCGSGHGDMRGRLVVNG